MPLDNSNARWHAAIDLARLRNTGRAVVRLEHKQIALFVAGDHVYACNNRCPHEGYPLVEGTVDAACHLTCQWHNWSFELGSGANRYGGDRLRTYPTRIVDGTVWVDITDPPAAERIDSALRNLREAFDDHDTPRIARELARLQKAGGDPLDAVAQAIVWSHERLEDGMTHAYAATAGWLQLRDACRDEDARLVCLSEAIGHMAWDVLREPPSAREAPRRSGAFPYPTATAPYSEAAFLSAIEAQDEAAAIAQLRGALQTGLHFADLEHALTRAALAHYNAFGHALIYVVMIGRLIARLGARVEAPLLLAYVRELVRATREDLIPDFRDYAAALAQWPAASPDARPEAVAVDGSALSGLSIKRALQRTGEFAATLAPEQLHVLLLDAGVLNLLRFDDRYEFMASDNVSDNIGWLDFTHALTFGNAARLQCTRFPELWPQALLQMALFVGRNGSFLLEQSTEDTWRVTDAPAFDAACTSRILDHGIGLPIYPAHWLKTTLAVREEIEAGAAQPLALRLRAALNRFLHAPLKQKNGLGAARQALSFVARED